MPVVGDSGADHGKVLDARSCRLLLENEPGR